MSDYELVASYQKSGDQRMVACLLERHRSAFVAVGHRFLKNEADVQDFGQELFLLMCRRLPGLDLQEVRSFPAFLRSVMHRAALDALRRRQTYRGHLDQFAGGMAGEEELVEWNPGELDHALLHEALEQLPEMEGEAIRMIYLQGLSYKEAALQLELDYNQVRGFRDRGLKRLKTLLKDDFSDYFD